MKSKLSWLEAQGLQRTRRAVEGSDGSRVNIAGKSYLAFASNDYLGLSGHPDLVAAAHQALDQYGVGAGASALISGHSILVSRLESTLASWLGFERVLHFSTGYMANMGIIQAMVDGETDVFSDALNHSSLIDGIRLSKARSTTVYPHLDMGFLEHALLQSTAREKWVVSDAVFSMDGDLAPIPTLVDLCRRHGARLMLDDAHGFGVLGQEGRGSLGHWGIRTEDFPGVYMATLGKAAGVFGAFVAGCSDDMEWLMQRCRTYIFTTGTPPVLAAAALAALERIRKDEYRREHLRRLGKQLQSGLRSLPWKAPESETAIHPLVVGDNSSTMKLAGALWDRDIWVPAIRPPTVPHGTARLRISLSALHQPEQVADLLEALKTMIPT